MNRISQLQSMLEKKKDPFLYFALAKEFEKESEAMKALENYRILIHDYPDYIASYYHLGKLLESLQEHQEALQIYRAGLAKCISANDLHNANELKEAIFLLDEED